MTDFQPEEPRLRRKSTFRLWSKREEDDLVDCASRVQSEDTHGPRSRQIWHMFKDLGHEGFVEEELMKKVGNIHKIREMLRQSDNGDVLQRSFSGSLLENQRWEEETLYMVKSGSVDAFSKRLSAHRRASEVSDERNRTALHHAAGTGNLALTQMICQTSDNLQTVDIDGRTPLFHALEGAHEEIADWLVAEGAQVNVADNKGITPLHIAAHTNNRHAVRTLLETGKCDVNATDSKGITPLHQAAHRASSEIVELLLNAGANPSLKDKHGNLPEQLARRMDKHSNHRRLSEASAAKR
ncbi:hypothetical protein DIPPA_54807 [Diplonema papillatum]|nr:hypothetical protein DIPPA_54807 [Diplonema papillatum]